MGLFGNSGSGPAASDDKKAEDRAIKIARECHGVDIRSMFGSSSDDD